MKAYKTFVESEEMNRKVQEKAFRLGYRWSGGKPSVVHDEYGPFLFFYYDGHIEHSSMAEELLDESFEYISAQDFLALPEPEQPFDLQPFERVLVRDGVVNKWRCDFFSHKKQDWFICIGGNWLQIARYEGNERYLGTSTDIPGSFRV